MQDPVNAGETFNYPGLPGVETATSFFLLTQRGNYLTEKLSRQNQQVPDQEVQTQRYSSAMALDTQAPAG